METRRKSFEPTSIAQYYESVSDCLSFNAAAERQRYEAWAVPPASCWACVGTTTASAGRWSRPSATKLC